MSQAIYPLETEAVVGDKQVVLASTFLLLEFPSLVFLSIISDLFPFCASPSLKNYFFFFSLYNLYICQRS